MGNKCVGSNTDSRSEREAGGSSVAQPTVQEVDWSDEMSVSHRSAMNSLHNYALGKMEGSADFHQTSKAENANSRAINGKKACERNSTDSIGLGRLKSTNTKKSKNQGISFADILEFTHHFQEESVDYECINEFSSDDRTFSDSVNMNAIYSDESCSIDKSLPSFAKGGRISMSVSQCPTAMTNPLKNHSINSIRQVLLLENLGSNEKISSGLQVVV
jgi:hypothetical protein